MKRTILLLIASVVVTAMTHATIRTVSNFPTTTIAQFSTIQDAINASSSGDSVYVHGSPNAYAGFSLNNKRLVIIGPGWSPVKNLPFVATINSAITITGSLCARSELHGLSIFAAIHINSNQPDSLRFYRNYIIGEVLINQASTTYRNYIFEGNACTSPNSLLGANNSIYENLVVRNNYFHHAYFSEESNMKNFSNAASTILIDHNLWVGTGRNCFISCAFLTITNNIFVNRNAGSGNSNSVFNNNITFISGNDTPWNSNGNVDAGGNVAGQNPQMVDQTSVNTGNFLPLINFTIPSGPANNAGSDSKDMGLLFDPTGSLNWTNSRNSRLPRIFSMNITNPTIAVNGTLNVNVEARKSN